MPFYRCLQVLLIVFLGYLSGCTVPENPVEPVKSTVPELTITTLNEPALYRLVTFKATLDVPDTNVEYRWKFSLNGTTVVRPDTVSIFYYEEGQYQVTCSATIKNTDSSIASDTLNVTIGKPVVSYDESVTRSATKVTMIFNGLSEEATYNLGRLTMGTRSDYRLTLPLGDASLIWSDSGASFSVGERMYDTSSNAGQPVYHENEVSQRVSLHLNGSTIPSAWLRSVNFRGWREGGIEWEDSKHYEFKASDLVLVSQRGDSTIFMLGGAQMQTKFGLTYSDMTKMDPDPRMTNGYRYSGTEPFYLFYSTCRVILHK
jgi:hypothetical protein